MMDPRALLWKCVVVLMTLVPGWGFAAEEAGPNVVLIIGDDQSWTDFGFMGHETIETPHLDRLASESLMFPRGYVPASLCRPSLASIISGQFPHQHRLTGNEPPKPADLPNGELEYFRQLVEMNYMMNRLPRLPELLKQRGYLSFQSGKWWEGHYGLGGFTHGMTHGDPKRGGRHGDKGLEIGREGLEPIFNFIDNTGDRPFFVWYAPFLPHRPHNPPERLVEKYRGETDSIHVARYWAMCEWFDETCGELLAHLDERELADETIVIFVSDNGWIQQTDGGGFAPRSKRSPYEGGTRTPILIRWPGEVEPREVDIPVSSIDLAPTILEACGLDPHPDMPGLNLLDGEAVQDREAVFGDVYRHNAVDIEAPARNLNFRWVVRDPWKLIVPHEPNKPEAEAELFHLRDDPHEKNNLASDRPETVRELGRRLDDWWDPGTGD